MSYIKPVIKTLVEQKSLTQRFVQRPVVKEINAVSFKNLRPIADELCLSNKKQFISLKEVKKTIPDR